MTDMILLSFRRAAGTIVNNKYDGNFCNLIKVRTL